MKKSDGKQDEEFAELHSLEYRLGELLVGCRGIAIGMSDDLRFEVWGNVRGDGRSEMVKLAEGPDLREAVRRAWLAAEEEFRTAAAAEATRRLLADEYWEARTRAPAQ